MKKIIKNLVRKLYSFIYKIKLRKKNVMIDKNVLFFNAKFKGYNRIYKNSNITNSEIGKFTYVGEDSFLYNARIGSFCSISNDVRIIYGTHPTDKISTHPIFYSNRNQCGTSFLNKSLFNEFSLINNSKSLLVNNDVWIGYGARIIEGVKIDNGAIILAGAVVTKDVKAYSIVGGIPARHIRYRFNENEISLLMKFQWWNKDDDWIKSNLDKFMHSESFFNFILENTKK